jgi:hypothetical protein
MSRCRLFGYLPMRPSGEDVNFAMLAAFGRDRMPVE